MKCSKQLCCLFSVTSIFFIDYFFFFPWNFARNIEGAIPCGAAACTFNNLCTIYQTVLYSLQSYHHLLQWQSNYHSDCPWYLGNNHYSRTTVILSQQACRKWSHACLSPGERCWGFRHHNHTLDIALQILPWISEDTVCNTVQRLQGYYSCIG